MLFDAGTYRRILYYDLYLFEVLITVKVYFHGRIGQSSFNADFDSKLGPIVHPRFLWHNF